MLQDNEIKAYVGKEIHDCKKGEIQAYVGKEIQDCTEATEVTEVVEATEVVEVPKGVKKAFIPLVLYLDEWAEAMPLEIYRTLRAFAETKRKTKAREGAVTIRDNNGVVLAIKCYYFKVWFAVVGPNAVDFKPKASSSTGYDQMSTAGKKYYNEEAYKKRKAAEDTVAALLEAAKIGDEAQVIQDAEASALGEPSAPKPPPEHLYYKTDIALMKAYLKENGLSL